MPTIFTHPIVGLSVGRLISLRPLPFRFWVLSFICPALPDIDVIGIPFGIASESVFGHRGLTHSFVFAIIISILVVKLFFRTEKILSLRGLTLTLYFTFITGSHGMLDALSDGNNGVVLFWPFKNTKVFFPFTPIMDSPISLKIFGEQGYRILINEFLLIWLPLISIVSLNEIRLRKLYRFSKNRFSKK